jgi:hypothetical protein
MVQLPDAPMPTVEAIYAAYEARQDNGWRPHLGGSVIGTKCERALWYGFRWATKKRHPGRLLRLFQTGHLEEPRLVDDLRAIGCEVQDIDPETGKQWNLRDATGHCGGSMDAVLLGIPEAPKTWHGGEFKTHSQKSFDALVKDKVKVSKPLHWAQMQIYMFWSGLTRFLYLARNKNTDELYQERVESDPAEGARLDAKGARIVNASRAPEKIASKADWYECKMCDHHAVCWEGKQPERHCRSCLHSTPAAGGIWTCAKHHCDIPADCEALGCEDHLFIPDFIDGEVMDASDHGVVYQLKDGSLYTDGVPF